MSSESVVHIPRKKLYTHETRGDFHFAAIYVDKFDYVVKLWGIYKIFNILPYTLLPNAYYGSPIPGHSVGLTRCPLFLCQSFATIPCPSIVVMRWKFKCDFFAKIYLYIFGSSQRAFFFQKIVCDCDISKAALPAFRIAPFIVCAIKIQMLG